MQMRWMLWTPWLLLALSACADKEEPAGTACFINQDCARGTLCLEGACVERPCQSLNECPSGTCLFDLKMCSAKECADVVEGQELFCGGERPLCLEQGSFRGSCVGASVSCSGDAECAALGNGSTCCGGACRVDCPDMATIRLDSGVEDAAPAPDSEAISEAGAPAAQACGACINDGDCAALGDGARCTAIGDGQYCTQACAGEDDCPPGFQCVNGLNQCLPGNYRCTGCLADGCPAGQVCDYVTAECTPPRGGCGACNSDQECAAGFSCVAMGNAKHCFAPCGAGDSCEQATYQCLDGFCKPSSAVCDACDSLCAGETPICIDLEGVCGECGDRQPCEAPLACNPLTHRCEENDGCLSSADCTEPDARFCFGGDCVQCMQTSDCPPRNECDAATWQCVSNPCAGVECQIGSVCNMETGRCDPGCQTVDDCAPLEGLACNAGTGQCYFTNGACDIGGGEAVCAPGSQCGPGLDPTAGICSCRRENPLDVTNLTEIISCQPGVTCLHGEWPWGSGQYAPNGFCMSF